MNNSPARTGAPIADLLASLDAGNEVGLVVAGATMTGRIQHIGPDTISIRIPVADQPDGLRQRRMHGVAVISVRDGAANVPVSIWLKGHDLLVLQLIGPPEFIQRRRFRRAEVEVPATILWQDPHTGTWSFARSRTLDISLGGVKVASAATVWPSRGALVRVKLDLPGGEVDEQAQVIGKTAGYDLRLEFQELSTATAASIRALTG